MKKEMQASEILHALFVRGDAAAEARMRAERRKIKLVTALRELREKSGLTQAELARKVGTTTARIVRFEDPNYDGHSLDDLQRMVSALGMELEWKIVRKESRKRGAA